MYQYILVNSSNGVGHITLNSEKTLNALNQVMAEELYEVLTQWEKDNSISCIFLDGAGSKAFCAGGDIKNLYQALKNSSDDEMNETCLKFFITEYSLDYKIHTYSKPIVTWNSGITMGGGMGLMNGASHRVVTSDSILAMPEVSIGLYPDVGATWFFNKLTPGLSYFLSLTGARFNAQDALELKLADFCLAKDGKEKLLAELREIKWCQSSDDNKKRISQILKTLQIKTSIESFTGQHLGDFKKIDNISTVQEFIDISKTFAPSSWMEKCLETFYKGSPSSAGIILEQLRRGRDLSLEEVFESELQLSVHCSMKPDFKEGVRALLIDKDQSPKWTPGSFDEVTQEWLSSYFTPIEGLKLFS